MKNATKHSLFWKRACTGIYKTKKNKIEIKVSLK